MFHWICPECGCEIAPTVRECPACDGPEHAELVLAGVVEASARTQSPTESRTESAAEPESRPETSAAPVLSTAADADAVRTNARSAQETVSRATQTEAQAQSEPVVGVAQTEAAPLETMARAEQEPESSPLSVALLEDVADLHAPVPEPSPWRRKNGHTAGAGHAGQNGSAQGSDPIAESSTKEEARSESPAPLDAADAMKLLAAPVAIPQPEPSAAVPVLPAAAAPLSPEQAQNAAAALQNLSSGVAGAALEEQTVEAAEVASQEAESKRSEPEKVPVLETATVAPASEAAAEADAESVALIPEILDAKAAAEKSIEARAADLLARLNTGREETERVGRSVRTRAVESRSLETHGVDSQPVETHALNGKRLNGKSLDLKSVDAKPVEAKPVDAEPVEAKPVDVEAAAHESVAEAAPTDARDFEGPVAPVAREAAPPQESVVAPPPPKALPTPTPKVGKFGRLLRMATEGHKPGSQIAKQNPPAAAAAPANTDSSDTNAVDRSRIRLDAPDAAVPSNKLANKIANEPATEIANELANVTSNTPASDPAEIPVAPFDATARQLPLPLYPAPVSPSTAAVLLKGRRTSHEEPIATPSAASSESGNVPFSENVPLLTNKLRQAPTEPALVDKKLPLIQPGAATITNNFAPPVAIPPSAGSVRPPRSKADGPAPRWGRLVRNPAIAKSAVRPASPPRDAIKTFPAPSLTLPGPMLTPSLVAFHDKELVPRLIGFGPHKKRWGNAWLLVALLGGTTLGVGLTGLLSNLPRPEPSFKDASKDTPAPAAAKATPEAPIAPQAKPSTHPIPKSIELSGFRIVGDPNDGGEQIRFTVVNHGPTRFTDGVVYVALRAANSRQPLYRFTFAAPNLGPYESREMSSIAKKVSEDGSLPGWQDLRADVEVGQQ